MSSIKELSDIKIFFHNNEIITEQAKKEVIFVSTMNNYKKIPNVKRLCERIKNKGFVRGLYYEIEGEGIPLLLINGGPGATHHYFHPFFSKAKNYSKIIYYDQAGCGLSRRDKNYSIKNSLEDIEILRNKLKIKKWLLFGHSWGGFLAQIYVLKYTNRVLGLILCSSSPGFKIKITNQRQKNKILNKKEIIEINKIKKSNYKEKIKYFNILLNGAWKKYYYKKPNIKRLAEISLYDYETDLSFPKIIDKETKNIDLKGKFDNLKIPTLIVEGEKDLTWEEGKIKKIYQNHPNSEMVIMKKSKHYPFEDEPEIFFKTLEKFISKNSLLDKM